ncbi:hypothetical protein GF371_05540 [Candidatus Woesearchaeota archaeon]|nr:hypothetical protein [Candidatus Woesearchaeota archaeon]
MEEKRGEKKMERKKILAVSSIALLLIAGMLLAGCGTKETEAPVKEIAYDPELEERIRMAEEGNEQISERPDYLPPAMFKELPKFPKDFYRVRTLVRIGRIADLENLEPRYWLQPEFFPEFEKIGVPLLLDAPTDRWGAYGISSYPGDSIANIVAGDTLDLYFFIKSSYLVETYQGVHLVPKFPQNAEIPEGVTFPDGTKEVLNPEDVEDYFDIEISPNPFILEPNFPIYQVNGTRKIQVKITPREDTPLGNYVIAFDTGEVPEEKEQEWQRQYLNLYASGSMTKIERPYYQVYFTVSAPPEEEASAETTENEIENEEVAE